MDYRPWLIPIERCRPVRRADSSIIASKGWKIHPRRPVRRPIQHRAAADAFELKSFLCERERDPAADFAAHLSPLDRAI